jgi:hypothetical protein
MRSYPFAEEDDEKSRGGFAMLGDLLTRRTILGVLVAVLTLMADGSLLTTVAAAEESDNTAALKKRFKYLSQHGNVECSVQFEKLIGTMGPDGRLQGSCCAPMDEARYRQQIEGLKQYADIAEVPPDPYDISAPLAHKLMGYYDMALDKEEQAAYDYAMEHSDMQGPCCCKCWRWKVYGGLGKYLIHTRHFTGQQLTDLWNVGQGCGGAIDTKMH